MLFFFLAIIVIYVVGEILVSRHVITRGAVVIAYGVTALVGFVIGIKTLIG